MADKGKEIIVYDDIGYRVLELYVEMEATNLSLSTVIDLLQANPKHASKAQDFQVAIEQMMRSQQEVKNQITSWQNIDPQTEETAKIMAIPKKLKAEVVTNYSVATGFVILGRMEDLDKAVADLTDEVKKSPKNEIKEIQELEVVMEAMKKKQEVVKNWMVMLMKIDDDLRDIIRTTRKTSTEEIPSDESTATSPYSVASTSRNQPTVEEDPFEMEEDDKKSEA